MDSSQINVLEESNDFPAVSSSDSYSEYLLAYKRAIKICFHSIFTTYDLKVMVT